MSRSLHSKGQINLSKCCVLCRLECAAHFDAIPPTQQFRYEAIEVFRSGPLVLSA